MTRGETKRVMREALKMRILSERQTLKSNSVINFTNLRLEQNSAIGLLKNVPTIFAFAESIDSRYRRPDWASKTYGSN